MNGNASRDPPFRFLEGFGEPRWVALWAAMFGFLLDAMDVLFYLFALQPIRAEFGLSLSQAGLVTTATMLSSAAGGVLAGILSDRIGRRKTLMLTILAYSIGSGGSALSGGLGSLIFWRAIVGLGLGGEWSAGSVLVAESWPAHHRAKAVSFMQSGWALGYMAASLLSAAILPSLGWRILFLVGMLPALLTVFVRRKVHEPEVWSQREHGADWTSIFRTPLRRNTVVATALATTVLIAYWGLFSWLPGFLSGSKESGGAGMDIVKSGLWVFTMQAGAFAGYQMFGVLADRWGRKPAFTLYVLVSAALTPIYGLLPGFAANPERWLLLLGPLIGFFGTGYFSLFGAMLAELFPTAVRGAGQGFVYNFGRGLSALMPFVIGAAAERAGIGSALTFNAVFYLLAAALVAFLPETRNVELRS